MPAVDICDGRGRQAGFAGKPIGTPAALSGQLVNSFNYVHMTVPFPFKILYKGEIEEKRFNRNKNSTQMSKHMVY